MIWNNIAIKYGINKKEKNISVFSQNSKSIEVLIFLLTKITDLIQNMVKPN